MIISGRKTVFQKIQHHAAIGIGWLAALLAFSLPLSTSAVSVLAILILIAWVFTGEYFRKWAIMTSNPVCLALLAYLSLFVLGLLWSQDVAAGLETMAKQWKLLLFPVLLSSIAFEQRRRYVVFFLVGLTVAMLMTYLAWFDILHYGGVTPEHPTKRLFHVIYNPLLAFGFYLVCHEVIWGKWRGIRRLALIVLAACMAFDMFITEGRTGQVAFFVLLGLLFVQFFRGNVFRGLLFALCIPPLIFIAGYQLSPTFQLRVNAAGQEIRQFQENPDTSVGLRLFFWKNSWQIISAHPLFGVGTGDFQSSYAEVNKEFSPEMVATDNPHNQYVFILCQFGILGLFCLLAIFLAQLYLAARVKDDWQRIRFAFPIFFLTIMLAESYLVIYETGFFFALFSAVLYLKKIDRQQVTGKGTGNRWLILAYLFNIDGKAASQTITDRIPLLLEEGVRPIVLSGPTGEKDTRFTHRRVFSCMPSGLQYELRFLLKKSDLPSWFRELLKALVTVVFLPLYLVERVVVHLDTHWSWGISGAAVGCLYVFRSPPDLIYSTAGPSSTHFAAYLLHKLSGIPWIAEVHDPLVYDIEKRKWHQRYLFNNWLEKKICSHAVAVIYFTRHALESADRRHPIHGQKVVLRPGADPPPTPGVEYCRREKIHFGHFGSLATTRNLSRLIEAFYLLFKEDPYLRQQVVLDIYGSGLDDISRKTLAGFPLEQALREHGRLEYDERSGKSGRRQVLEAMKRCDVLVILHGSGLICEEYVPSKVYEYLLTGRPVLALTAETSELGRIVLACGHRVVDPDDASAIKDTLGQYIREWQETGLPGAGQDSPYTIKNTVSRLLAIARKTVSDQG